MLVGAITVRKHGGASATKLAYYKLMQEKELCAQNTMLSGENKLNNSEIKYEPFWVELLCLVSENCQRYIRENTGLKSTNGKRIL